MLYVCMPVDTSGLPDVGMPAPQPSIEHTIDKCQMTGCGIEIWVGPKQLADYRARGGYLLCMVCGVKVANFLESGGSEISVEVLDPNADDIPRRV
jgi:hypothetical protein